MKKLFVMLIVLLCAAVPSQSQLLYKISGKGLAQPSYLFGTHHLAKLSILDSIKGMKPAFESVKQVIGEVDTKDMMTMETMQLMQQEMIMSGDTTLQKLFTPDDYAKVSKCITANVPGVQMEQLQKVCPAFLSNQLSMVLMMKQTGELNINEQLDMTFQKNAREKGKGVVGLETIKEQFEVLFKGASLQRQAELLVCLIDNIKEEAQKALELTAYYNNQKLEAMYKLSQERDGTKCDSYPSEEAKLITDRNDRWMKKLPDLMKAMPSMIVVGALHLTGPKGLIAQLRKAGYKVTPVW
jgi:uncharacterized protein YbaP (TraB family)